MDKWLEFHMQRIKIFIAVLAIVVLSATSFESIAHAAKAIRVDPWSKLVVIDEGEQAGFTLGSTVCFFSKTGE